MNEKEQIKKDYDSVSEWYEDNKGDYPLAMARGIARLMKEKDWSFQEAYEYVSRSKK